MVSLVHDEFLVKFILLESRRQQQNDAASCAEFDEL
jgi:hypothetical protein